MLCKFKEFTPKIGKDVFVAKNATVIGNVSIADHSSVWYGAVLRGDVGEIVIGKYTNIQDNSVLHIPNGRKLIIGEGVTIGHKAVCHGCDISDRVLVGMGSIIMDGVKVGSDTIIGAGALITEGNIIPPRSLVLGFPAKVVRELMDDEIASIKTSAKWYAELAKAHMNDAISIDSDAAFGYEHKMNK
ncbi:MAG: gamma carbonic anhydrase family protein [Pseudomonadota bacterium]